MTRRSLATIEAPGLLIPLPFSKSGVLTAPYSSPYREYIDIACSIVTVRAGVGTAPTGSTILIDLNKNGTTVFTTQSNRPTIPISGFTDLADAIDVPTLSVGDYLGIDIDQVGSTIPGSNLTVVVWVKAI